MIEEIYLILISYLYRANSKTFRASSLRHNNRTEPFKQDGYVPASRALPHLNL